MSAFDEIIEKNGSDNLSNYRKMLVSPKGSLVSGLIPEYMGLTTRSRNRVLIDALSDGIEEASTETSPDEIGALFIKKPGKTTKDYGFVFCKEGTEKVIRDLIAGNPLSLFKDYNSLFLFENQQKADLWNSAREATKRRLIAYDLLQLKKKTDIQYRVHGSRLHYLTLGKITAIVHEKSKAQRMVFPLFLFDCIDMDSTKQIVEIEQSGFVNFSADERFFNSEIQRIVGGPTIDIDEALPSRLIAIKSRIEKIENPNVDNIEVDVTFGMISIVTGFETEYLDKVWEKIL